MTAAASQWGGFLFLLFAFLCISFKGISFPFKIHTAKRLNKSATRQIFHHVLKTPSLVVLYVYATAFHTILPLKQDVKRTEMLFGCGLSFSTSSVRRPAALSSVEHVYLAFDVLWLVTSYITTWSPWVTLKDLSCVKWEALACRLLATE